jgi:beta-glucosidase
VTDFPAGFLWGASTAAHQIEGGNVNNDNWVIEHTAGSPWMGGPSGDACDSYHRYAEDVALLADAGLNTYRFSLEWSRIEPEPGEFSRAALEHYRRMLATCHEHGVTPLVTFLHFTSPRWLVGDGGWEDAKTPDRFGRYCERAMKHLGDLVPYACTINEVNVSRMLADTTPAEIEFPSDVRGEAWFRAAAAAMQSDPQRCMPFHFACSDRAVDVIMAAQRRAVETIKGIRSDTLVGPSLAVQGYDAVAGGEAKLHQLRSRVVDAYLEALGDVDYLGVQTYARLPIGPDGPVRPEDGVELTQTGEQFSPEVLEDAIRYAIAKTGLPVIVTENGIATEDDTRRVEYIRRAVQAVARCLRDGLDVRGYIHWTLLDNFEWAAGFFPKYGLIAVDRETYRRTVKPSARFLGDIARRNSL